MGFSCGIVGLPNVGKSTLFNSLSNAKAEAANFPFCTIEPNVGIVPVPDKRIDALAKVYGSERLVPTSIRFVDIAGLVRGASKGEGLGNQFLSHIREVDAVAYVLRCFDDGDVTHVENRVDAGRSRKPRAACRGGGEKSQDRRQRFRVAALCDESRTGASAAGTARA